MLNFPDNPIKITNQKEREKLDLLEQKKRDNFQSHVVEELKGFNIPEIKPISTKIFPISQKASRFTQMPYGKIGTVGGAGCGPLALEYAIRLLGFYVNFDEIIKECVDKGYRAYIYNEKGEIFEGSGTEYSLFDNCAIELQNLKEIVKYLQAGCPITILMQNAIYNGNSGNHFITLVGIENDDAIMMDGNCIITEKTQALVKMPFYQAVSGFRGAWAWEKTKIQNHLK